MNILFIGCGNLGGAIVSQMTQSGSFNKGDVTVLLPDWDEANTHKAKYDYGVNVINAYNPEIRYDIIVLAVKPQIMDEILAIYKNIDLNTVVISLAAGKSLQYLEGFFKDNLIVRTMSNMPAMVGYGCTALIANKDMNQQNKGIIDKIFGSIGKYFWLDDESLMDGITGVSGSGPAYFFLFVEYLTEAAKNMGLADDLAETIARQTFIGAAEILKHSGKTPEELRKSVTSPNGTTFAAINKFKENSRLHDLIFESVDAARRRSEELS